jgi:hypothetical protein
MTQTIGQSKGYLFTESGFAQGASTTDVYLGEDKIV